MLFHSFEFVFGFLPVTLGVYLLLRAHAAPRVAHAWVTAASLFFYAWWDWRFLFLLLFSIFTNYGLSLLIARRERGDAVARALLIAGLLFNVGMIGYFKYRNFFLENVNVVFGTHFTLERLILPLGISFYTFQKIAYLIDVWRGKFKPPDLLDYGLFVSFFPQLIAGPIVHHNEIIPQLQKPVIRISRTMVAVGTSIFIIGMFKKLVLADSVGVYFSEVAPKVMAGQVLGFVAAWAAITAAATQIYLDYSAYSDMAIGLGLLFGIRLPVNFFSPYRGSSVLEFWRRWNLTLMRFLRDCVYIPMGGSRYGIPRRMLATFVTMLVCGIWHGAGWNYIVWGLAVGTLMNANVLLREWMPPPERKSLLQVFFGRAITFVGYVGPLVWFLFPTLEAGNGFLASMVGLHGISGPLPGREQTIITLVCLAVMYLMPNTQQLFGRFRPALEPTPLRAMEKFDVPFRWHPTLGWALLIAAMAIYALGYMHRVKTFFYFQF